MGKTIDSIRGYFYNETNYTGTLPKLPSRGYFKKGDKGSEVKNVQKFLNWALSIKLSVDGSYRQLTKEAVERYERTVQNKDNGKFGKNDLAKAKEYRN